MATGFLLDNVESRNFSVFYKDETRKELEKLEKEAVVILEDMYHEKEIKEERLKTVLDLINKKIPEKRKEILVADNLEEELKNCKEDTFYYISTNKFVLDYYKKNPESEWKIKAVLQFGFPFEFIDEIKGKDLTFEQKAIINVLKGKEWSIFIFSKKQFSYVTLGFNSRNTYANLETKKNKLEIDKQDKIKELPNDYTSILFCVWDSDDDDQDIEIEHYLGSEKIPRYSKSKKEKMGYSFTEVPIDYFRIDYLDYLSRYKDSVVELFGYPEKNEKIKELRDVVDIVGDARTGVYNSTVNDRKPNLLINKYFFQNGYFKPTIFVGEEKTGTGWFPEEYEIHPSKPDISSYYLYCLLSSELISDYYSERYSAKQYYDSSTILPIEECVYIEMSPEKMNSDEYKKKYEFEVNDSLEVHDIISTKKFSSIKNKDITEKYLVEIKNDIDIGSYYSATILIGSVLEALLIDWLSEIDGKNYVKDDYYVFNKKTGHEERATFYDYIEIMKKKRPDWINNKSKLATEIRKKRNLVHPKLYIANGEISADTCYELLEDLKTIVKNRWPDKK